MYFVKYLYQCMSGSESVLQVSVKVVRFYLGDLHKNTFGRIVVVQLCKGLQYIAIGTQWQTVGMEPREKRDAVQEVPREKRRCPGSSETHAGLGSADFVVVTCPWYLIPSELFVCPRVFASCFAQISRNSFCGQIPTCVF